MNEHTVACASAIKAWRKCPDTFAHGVAKHPNWGGGWNWVETFHPSQQSSYGVRLSPGIGDIALTRLYPSSSPHTFAYFTKA